jgi:hypothetical protein
MPIGQQTVVADADEATRQHVLEEATDQLFGSEMQKPLPAAVAVGVVGQDDRALLHPE